MAAPRKARGQLSSAKRRVARRGSRQNHHQRVKKPKAAIDPATRRKNLACVTTTSTNAQSQPSDKAVVEEWVYRFLGNLAAIEAERMASKNRKPTIRFKRIKRTRKSENKKKKRRFRSPTPFSWDRVVPASSPAKALRLDHPAEMNVSDREEDADVRDLIKVQRANRLPSRTRSAFPVTVKTEKSSEDRSTLKKINGYIKAGIAEGKRRAKSYVRKALAFSLRTGYLVPADRDGKFLKVSPSLVNQVKNAAVGRIRKPAARKSRNARGRTSGRRRRKTATSTRRSRGRKSQARKVAVDVQPVQAKNEVAEEVEEEEEAETTGSDDRQDRETSNDSESEEQEEHPEEEAQSGERGSSSDSSAEESKTTKTTSKRGNSVDLDRKPLTQSRCCVERRAKSSSIN